MNFPIRTFLLTCVLVWGSWLAAQAASPSYFRHDSGVGDDSDRLVERLDPDENLVWRQALAPGNSSPCVCEDLIFVTTFREEASELATVAVERATGNVRWQQVAPTTDIEPYHRAGSPASCTPACDGQRLFIFFGSYGLLCYDLDGNLLWTKRMGPFQDEFGAASSPILVDDKVILNEDHDINSFIIALDQANGDVVWRVERDEFTRGYSTPVVWGPEHARQVVVAGSLQLTAYNVRDGSKLWWVNGLSRLVDNTPVIGSELLFVASQSQGGGQSDRISMKPFAEALEQYDNNDDGAVAKSELPDGGDVHRRFFRIDLNQNGTLEKAEWEKHARVFELAQNVAMAIRPGGSGDITDTHVQWQHRRGLPVIPSPLVYRGVFYMVKDGGILTSLDAATGKTRRQGRTRGGGRYFASLVAGDGKVLACNERGVVTILTAGGDWKIVSSYDFHEKIKATPVIEEGRIYLRTEAALYCFGS